MTKVRTLRTSNGRQNSPPPVYSIKREGHLRVLLLPHDNNQKGRRPFIVTFSLGSSWVKHSFFPLRAEYKIMFIQMSNKNSKFKSENTYFWYTQSKQGLQKGHGSS
jgi:hypothetical protein